MLWQTKVFWFSFRSFHFRYPPRSPARTSQDPHCCGQLYLRFPMWWRASRPTARVISSANTRLMAGGSGHSEVYGVFFSLQIVGSVVRSKSKVHFFLTVSIIVFLDPLSHETSPRPRFPRNPNRQKTSSSCKVIWSGRFLCFGLVLSWKQRRENSVARGCPPNFPHPNQSAVLQSRPQAWARCCSKQQVKEVIETTQTRKTG